MKSALLFALVGGILYLLLAATYPPIHDTLHGRGGTPEAKWLDFKDV